MHSTIPLHTRMHRHVRALCICACGEPSWRRKVHLANKANSDFHQRDRRWWDVHVRPGCRTHRDDPQRRRRDTDASRRAPLDHLENSLNCANETNRSSRERYLSTSASDAALLRRESCTLRRRVCVRACACVRSLHRLFMGILSYSRCHLSRHAFSRRAAVYLP